MNNSDTVENNEILYRRVKKHTPNIHPNDRRYRRNSLGDLEVLPMAFYDTKNKPSVDRACKNNNPYNTQGDEGNGVIKLLAGDVLDMEIDYHKIDIIPDSPDENSVNPAHSRIIMIPINIVPSDMQKSLRGKFREYLALIANQLGWAIKPTEVPPLI